jgi:hypothetical protein
MSGAGEHAARLRHQREDVARLDDVFAAGVRRHRGADGVRTVVGRDAGGDAFGGFDRHREIGAHARGVARHHRADPEPPAALARQAQADQAARMARHEIDVLGPHLARGHDQIALVLAVLVIEDHDHAAGGDVGEDLGDGGEGHGWLMTGAGWKGMKSGARGRGQGKSGSRATHAARLSPEMRAIDPTQVQQG